ncbi:hypothetical protein CGZ60_00105 [Neisseria animalis]|nr:hypothetical protein CGZ60_00105 [Neisseria animalis]
MKMIGKSRAGRQEIEENGFSGWSRFAESMGLRPSAKRVGILQTALMFLLCPCVPSWSVKDLSIWKHPPIFCRIKHTLQFYSHLK